MKVEELQMSLRTGRETVSVEFVSGSGSRTLKGLA